MRMTSEPRRRISSCRRPTALSSLSSERNELEQTNSASAEVLWAAVVRSGRISWSTTGTALAASCHDASAAMDRNYSCPDEATMQAPPEGGAWQVDFGWLSLRAFLPPSGLVCPNERLQRASLRS